MRFLRFVLSLGGVESSQTNWSGLYKPHSTSGAIRIVTELKGVVIVDFVLAEEF